MKSILKGLLITTLTMTMLSAKANAGYSACINLGPISICKTL